jgi:Ca2+/Na+ antiporter
MGFVGILFYVWFIIYSLQSKEKEGGEPEKQEEDLEMATEEEEEDHENVPVGKGIAYLAIGGILIFASSSPFINAVVEAAAHLNVTPILLAFFLAPIASEAPEILESISLSRKGNSQSINIAYSNLIGGTITKTTLLCGIFCFFGVAKQFIWESPSYPLSLFLLIVCAGTAAGIGSFFTSQTKWHGLVLLVLFVIVGIVQFMNNHNVFEDDIPVHLTQHTQI